MEHNVVLALASHYPEVLHRPTHKRFPESAPALLVDFLGLPHTSIRAQVRLEMSARLACHSPSVGRDIPRWRTTFGYKALPE